MAIAADCIWELRSDASATTNGGGWSPSNAGGSGTDYSQQASPQYSPTAVLTSAGAGATILWASAAAVMQGNIINITAGTNFTTGRYVITGVTPGVSLTTDRNCTTGVGAVGTGYIGGAVQRLQDIAGTTPVAVAGNTVYVRSGTYSNATTDTIGADGTVAGVIKIIGYLAGGSRTDIDIIEASMPVFTTATNSIAKFTLNTANYLSFRNIKVTDTAATRGVGWVGVTAASTFIVWNNCICDGCLSGWDVGTVAFTENLKVGCVARNCSSATGAGFMSPGSSVNSDYYINCLAHDNAGDGWQLHITTTTGNAAVLIGCIADTNARDGVRVGITTGSSTRWAVTLINCTFYTNGVDGVHALTTSGVANLVLVNNIFYGNVTTGLHCDTASVSAGFVQYNNAFGANGANRNNVPAGYGDITLTVDPFISGSGRNFGLNNTAGGGALLRQLSYPAKVGCFDDATATYGDVGASRPQCMPWSRIRGGR